MKIKKTYLQPPPGSPRILHEFWVKFLGVERIWQPRHHIQVVLHNRFEPGIDPLGFGVFWCFLERFCYGFNVEIYSTQDDTLKIFVSIRFLNVLWKREISIETQWISDGSKSIWTGILRQDFFGFQNAKNAWKLHRGHCYWGSTLQVVTFAPSCSLNTHISMFRRSGWTLGQ